MTQIKLFDPDKWRDLEPPLMITNEVDVDTTEPDRPATVGDLVAAMLLSVVARLVLVVIVVFLILFAFANV
jgi:hypothetical protein